MKILAQHGFGNGQRIQRGLAEGLIEGAILGAKDITPTKLAELLVEMENESPTSVRLFDPQFYAALIAANPGARLGSLVGEAGKEFHPYFEARRRRELEREQKVISDCESVIRYQAGLPVSGLIAPNIVIHRSFDSAEATISKNFLRNAGPVARSISPELPVYATLAVSANALNDRIELQNFLQEITELDEPPNGFYLLLEKPDTTIPAALTEPDVLSRWMLVTHTLKLSGFEIINGYADMLAPYFGAVGSDAVASGWYNTLKTFSLRKFEPTSDFARRPVARYSSKPLMKSIRHTELHDLRDRFAIMNGLLTDEYYDPENGSAPESVEEALQNWACLGAMRGLATPGNVGASLEACHDALNQAEELFVEIANYGVTMRDRSSGAHVEMLREELHAFAELAEL